MTQNKLNNYMENLTNAALPSSPGVSFIPIRVPLDRRKEKCLLPFRRMARAIKPRIGCLARTSKGGNDLGGRILGKRFGEGHGQTVSEKEMSAMRKKVLALCLQCGQSNAVNQPHQTMSFNSYNPGLLTRNAPAIRIHMAAVCGNLNAEWSCYYFGPDCASIRDENGNCWDICLTTNSIIPA